MRVLMLGWEFPPNISGGLGTACFGLTKALSKMNISISFVVPKINGQLENSHVNLMDAESLVPMTHKILQTQTKHIEKYIEVPSFLSPYLNAETYKEFITETKTETETPFNFQNDYGENLIEEVIRYSKVGEKLGKKSDFDVIHCHDWMTFLAGHEAKKASGKKLIVHVHSTEFDRSGNNPNKDIFNIEKFGMQEANTIITVSNRTKNIIIHKYKISASKIHVVYNAVEKDNLEELSKLKKFSKTKDEKIVLFLGRITMQKGPEYFINACHKVSKVHPKIRFVMAGSGDMAKRMIEKMASLDLVDRFHFTGFLKPVERERLFSMSDLYIMPSVSEPFGITPLEAIKHNVPIIVSKQSGIAEILDSAVKVDFWDTDAMSDAMLSILNSKEVSKTQVENNKKVLEQIDWKHAASHIYDIYHSI